MSKIKVKYWDELAGEGDYDGKPQEPESTV